jgi:hypothetical protein
VRVVIRPHQPAVREGVRLARGRSGAQVPIPGRHLDAFHL